MGGKMVIESQYGIGTTFTISFHLGKEEEIAKILLPGKGLQNEEAGIQEKIAYTPEVLLVDDDQIVFRLISRYLTGRCSLEYAVDGRRALLAVTRKQFDIIFLDINLGIGLTGLQVVKKLRKIPGYEETPVVAITAFAMPGDKERAIASGCTFYQSKPFTRADIISDFNQCLQRIGRS
jgi:CheY-like chemotaxis protein